MDSRETNTSCCSSLSPMNSSATNEMNLSFNRMSPSLDGCSKRSKAEVLAASALNELSVQEREKVFEELNGIAHVKEEEPEIVDRCFFELRNEIKKVVDLDRSAYDRAIAMRPQLLEDRAFLLMFLRADSFNPCRAARRIIKHFNVKLELFGAEKLVKKITYEDLDEDDKQAINGAFRVLRMKDQGGRRIIFLYHKLMKNVKSWKNQMRGNWYQIMTTIEEDETSQKTGFIIVGYHVGRKKIDPEYRAMVPHLSKRRDAIPFRPVAIHLCYNTPHMRPLALLIQNTLEKIHSIRFRQHYGSNLECQYSLVKFGIPQYVLPIDPNGELKKEKENEFDNIRMIPKWSNDFEMEIWKTDVETPRAEIGTANPQIANVEVEKETCATESEATKPPGRFLLGNNDVLIEQGGYYHTHPGNARLQDLIEMYRNEYRNSSKFEKTCISLSILKMLQESKGRLLKRRNRKSDEWVEIDDNAARDVISHRFRNPKPRRWKADLKPSSSDLSRKKAKR